MKTKETIRIAKADNLRKIYYFNSSKNVAFHSIMPNFKIALDGQEKLRW